MKNNKIAAEEQDTDKLRKVCSKGKGFGRKWLAMLCLPGRKTIFSV